MRMLTCAIAVCALTVPGWALAQDQTVSLAPTAQPSPAASPAPAPPAVGGPTAIADDDLADLNGREGGNQTTVMSEQDLVAVNNGNTITAGSVDSGRISIERGAFDGFTGIGNFVINSGHNNNLQGAITINIVQP